MLSVPLDGVTAGTYVALAYDPANTEMYAVVSDQSRGGSYDIFAISSDNQD